MSALLFCPADLRVAASGAEASRRERASAFRPAAAPLFASHGLVLCSWVHGKRRYDVSENWPLFIMRRP